MKSNSVALACEIIADDLSGQLTLDMTVDEDLIKRVINVLLKAVKEIKRLEEELEDCPKDWQEK